MFYKNRILVYKESYYVEEASTRAVKKIISKLEDLRFCEYLPRKNIEDSGTVGEGLGFVIDRKVNVIVTVSIIGNIKGLSGNMS
ncbi:hypothetical protein [Bacillus cereus]|uniref:Uncharacterized protein n=1 Tax=Bacillus cereus VD048 TaxID=1053226 RepID=J8E867_BACCE|nr:hypothetical protein [Bacillus cereus]EJR27154.1 hypothetical protein IIG_04979 [Bacillus cereus VD048]